MVSILCGYSSSHPAIAASWYGSCSATASAVRTGSRRWCAPSTASFWIAPRHVQCGMLIALLLSVFANVWKGSSAAGYVSAD